MIAAAVRSNDVLAFVDSVHSTTGKEHLMDSTGLKLGREKSRRRRPHERPQFNEQGQRILRGSSGYESGDEKAPVKGTPVKAATGIRRSKSLHAKATGGDKAPDGYREQSLLAWHSSKSKRKKKESPAYDQDELRSAHVASLQSVPEPADLDFERQGQELSQYPTDGLATTTSNGNFITRLVSVIGDISCPVHPDRSIQSCPRECGWHIEHHVERGKLKNEDDEVNRSPISRSDSSTLVPSSPQPTSRPSTFSEIERPSKHYYLGIRPCYLLIFLGVLAIAGSLAPAIWRANVQGDLSGGFTLAQYILGVGIFIVGSMVAIHSRTCTCWQS